jgi:hypothetical protein
MKSDPIESPDVTLRLRDPNYPAFEAPISSVTPLLVAAVVSIGMPMQVALRVVLETSAVTRSLQYLGIGVAQRLVIAPQRVRGVETIERVESLLGMAQRLGELGATSDLGTKAIAAEQSDIDADLEYLQENGSIERDGSVKRLSSKCIDRLTMTWPAPRRAAILADERNSSFMSRTDNSEVAATVHIASALKRLGGGSTTTLAVVGAHSRDTALFKQLLHSEVLGLRGKVLFRPTVSGAPFSKFVDDDRTVAIASRELAREIDSRVAQRYPVITRRLGLQLVTEDTRVRVDTLKDAGVEVRIDEFERVEATLAALRDSDCLTESDHHECREIERTNQRALVARLLGNNLSTMSLWSHVENAARRAQQRADSSGRLREARPAALLKILGM